MLSLLDGFLGYNQVMVSHGDQLKKTFDTGIQTRKNALKLIHASNYHSTENHKSYAQREVFFHMIMLPGSLTQSVSLFNFVNNR